MAVAFLVDGFTEQRFIQKACPGRVVQRINLNGGTVGADAIAKRVASLIRLWRGKYYPIVVLVDLEDRQQCFREFASHIASSIRNNGVTDTVIVGVADRMFENWILGDPDLISYADCPACVDGVNGASKLKSILGGVYDKAGDGPGLLYAARASEIRLRSPSFEDVFIKLQGLSCRWLAG